MPLQTLRTSNSSLSLRAFVRARWFEAAYRLVFVSLKCSSQVAPGQAFHRGPADAFLTGNEAKKDITILP
jgi:hypothetical protein